MTFLEKELLTTINNAILMANAANEHEMKKRLRVYYLASNIYSSLTIPKG